LDGEILKQLMTREFAIMRSLLQKYQSVYLHMSVNINNPFATIVGEFNFLNPKKIWIKAIAKQNLSPYSDILLKTNSLDP